MRKAWWDSKQHETLNPPSPAALPPAWCFTVHLLFVEIDMKSFLEGTGLLPSRLSQSFLRSWCTCERSLGYRPYSNRRSPNRRSHTVNCDVDLNFLRSHTTPQNVDLNHVRSHCAPQNADLNTARKKTFFAVLTPLENGAREWSWRMELASFRVESGLHLPIPVRERPKKCWKSFFDQKSRKHFSKYNFQGAYLKSHNTPQFVDLNHLRSHGAPQLLWTLIIEGHTPTAEKCVTF